LDKSYPELGNVSIQEFLRNNPFAGLYVGMTSQILKEEDRKWLSFCGRQRRHNELQEYDGRPEQKSRPSIVLSNCYPITERDASTKYGFKSFVVYESHIKTNVCFVEDAIQNFLQFEFEEKDGHKGLRLGRHFWRWPAMGDMKHTKDGHYKTFVTFSADIGQHYGQDVKVNYIEY
jgi:hypothetical protein